MFKYYRLTIFIIFLLSVLFFYSCLNHSKNEQIPVSKSVRGTFIDKVTVPGVIESANSFSISCPRIRMDATVSYIIPDGSSVKIGDTVCILEATELSNRYNEAIKNLKTSESEYNKSKSELDLQFLLLKAQVETIETTTEIKQLDSLQIKFSSPIKKQIIGLQLKQAEIEKQKILKQLEFLKRINASELQKMKLRIDQQRNRLNRAKETIDQLIITSKVEGIAIRANLRTTGNEAKVKEGDVVWDRMPLVQIPDMSNLQVRLELNETNYKRINPGQNVEISIDAIKGLKMKGKLKFKEPVGRPVKRNSKVKVFGSVVSIDSLIGNVTPGISATCDIIINEITDTILIPFVSVFDDDSIKVVYVKNDNAFEKRKISLSLYNNNIGVVKSGLEEDETIALIKPPESLIKKEN